uniref:CHK kinase-like domain-containing protein n=1 Tax=Stomoxys calcitrans TaxID=35570 RepID=A0A1I8PK60_STOCA
MLQEIYDSTKTVSFMMKVGQDTELYREMLKPHNVFDVEMGIYTDVIPELQEMFLDAGLNVRFSPKAYKLPTDEMHMLLENLKTQGFRNSNRLEGLDMKHSKCVLQKLAQWHAASAVRVATKGRYPDYIAKGYIKPQCYEIVKGLYENSKQVLLQCIKEYSNSDMYYDKVVQLQNNIVDELYKTIEREEDGDVFKVLTHGDIWSNNIMFKYDEDNGEVLETYFVDFQTPRYTSPAPDLLYFILSSCKYEIKLEKFDYLVAFYHKHLIENLRLLKYAKYVPTLKDIHYMVYRHGVWGYATVTIVMAAALCDPCNNADLSNILSESENATIFRRQMYSNPRYRKHMEAILPWLLNRGLLDC